jgi:hypothetical protein
MIESNDGVLTPCPFTVMTVFDETCSSSHPFTFSNVARPDTKPDENKTQEEDEDEPPKVVFTPVTEEDATYSKRYIPAMRLTSFVLLYT